MDIKIEELKSEDLEQYKKLIDDCFGESNDIEYYRTNYTKNENYAILVAKSNNIIVGSITLYKIDLFTFSFQPAIEVFNVAVLKEYRRNNIAKKLLEYTIKYAKDNNYKSIYLTCLSDAYEAHKLYEGAGLKKMPSNKYSINL